MKGPSPLIQIAASVSAGESLDGTGGSPVPLKNDFPNTLSVICWKVEDDGGGRSDPKRTLGGSAYFAKYADSHCRLLQVGLGHVPRSEQLLFTSLRKSFCRTVGKAKLTAKHKQEDDTLADHTAVQWRIKKVLSGCIAFVPPLQRRHEAFYRVRLCFDGRS